MSDDNNTLRFCNKHQRTVWSYEGQCILCQEERFCDRARVYEWVFIALVSYSEFRLDQITHEVAGEFAERAKVLTEKLISGRDNFSVVKE